MQTDDPVQGTLAAHSYKDIMVSYSISLFRHWQIHGKIQTNISKLKKFAKTIIYFCKTIR